MTYRVFTYGTLQIPGVMEAVTGRKFENTMAMLSDYARFSVRGQVFPGVIPKQGEKVEGRIYFNLNETDLILLDTFEDYLYERRPVDVVCNNEIVTAQLYVVHEKYYSLLSPQPWDINTFTQDHMPNYLASCRKFHEAYRLFPNN